MLGTDDLAVIGPFDQTRCFEMRQMNMVKQ